MFVLQISLAVILAVAHGDDSFSIGLGVLAPSYKQKVGVDGSVLVDFNQQKNGFSYSVSGIDTPTGTVKQQTAIGNDHMGGSLIRQSSQATHTDPHTGTSAVKHNEHAFHINPYLGQAAVHTNDAAGAINPYHGEAAYRQHAHNAAIAPGHASVSDAARAALISPHGNEAAHSIHAARADAVHGGIAHSALSSDGGHASNPHLGGMTYSHKAAQSGLDGHGYGVLSREGHSANAVYDPHGYGSANERGFQTNGMFDLHHNVGASNQDSYARHASHDAYGNYGIMNKNEHAAAGGPLMQPLNHGPPLVSLQGHGSLAVQHGNVAHGPIYSGGHHY